ncbi:MAG TPA: carbohydrate kinase family protein [Gemmatimonadaceae bacterium]|nr:carbohydrate kinase family protein [Gemmatimonadaceae bacterium]
MSVKRLGLIGTFVWDTLHGRDARTTPVEEWGGVTYSLSGLDAALPDDWQVVPLIKVGSDFIHRAREFSSTLWRMAPDAPLIEVPQPNNRVEIRYVSDSRRTERLTGGVPPWTWAGLKPLLGRLDALYVNLLSGWEIDLETAQLIRQHFKGPIYGDLHSLVLAIQPDGLRTPRPLPNVREWCACFDVIQVNEDEMALMAPDSMALAATAIDAGARCLVVTLGARGAVYFAAADFERLDDLKRPRPLGLAGGPMRTALVPTPILAPAGGDPTGCGDVWGATYFSRLLAGDKLGDAILTAHRAAGRNLEHRGATGLAHHLRGELSAR